MHPPVGERGQQPDQLAGLGGLDALVPGRCSRNSSGRHTLRSVKGTVTTSPAITKQFPRPIPSRPFADPSCCHAAPNTLRP